MVSWITVLRTRAIAPVSRSLLPHAQRPSAALVRCPRRFMSAVKPPNDNTVRRIAIGIFGEMNVGKSTLLNGLTQQSAAIVDSTPGTTADVKASLMQLHGLGPAKLFDTAGVDEAGELGKKKLAKSMQALKECDVALLVIEPSAKLGSIPDSLRHLTPIAKEVAARGRPAMCIFNLKRDHSGKLDQATLSRLMKDIESALGSVVRAAAPKSLANELMLKSFAGDFSQPEVGRALAHYLVDQLKPIWEASQTDVIPRGKYQDKVVFLNIPMDAETPQGRLLRPQAMVQEWCLRNFIPTLCYRMDLTKARSSDPAVREAERQRFVGLLEKLPPGSLIVTDSQAMDTVHPWTAGRPYDLTTFSIVMINYMSGGRLQEHVDGFDALQKLKSEDKVLIAEACNHLRIPDQCDDIGMVQIPRGIDKLVKGTPLKMDHAYGREFSDPVTKADLSEYQMVVHCGACMIDHQKLRARMEDCKLAGVPITNYGLLLAYAASPDAFGRVIAPFDIRAPEFIDKRA